MVELNFALETSDFVLFPILSFLRLREKVHRLC